MLNVMSPKSRVFFGGPQECGPVTESRMVQAKRKDLDSDFFFGKPQNTSHNLPAQLGGPFFVFVADGTL